MKRFGVLVFAIASFICGGAVAAEDCKKITATGHPAYPTIAFKEGDKIAGAAPDLVAAIAKQLRVPLESKDMGSWEEAQAAAQDGKADLIVGVYYNEARSGYLDYVQPAFMYDDVAVFVAKGSEFPFNGRDDLIGKQGVTNRGESYGNDFDDFMKDKLNVERTDGIVDAFQRLIAGKADFLIAGYHPGLAEAAASGLKDQVAVLDQALLTAEMFVAFSKKSACRTMATEFGQGITEMTTDGRFETMLTKATAAWDKDQAKK